MSTGKFLKVSPLNEGALPISAPLFEAVVHAHQQTVLASDAGIRMQ